MVTDNERGRATHTFVTTVHEAYARFIPVAEGKQPIRPNPMQEEVWEYMESSMLGIGLLLKGPTGAGKTETITIPALAHGKRLIMVYPTRSLVDDQVGRMAEILQRYSLENGDRPVSLTIDTGAQSSRRVWHAGEEMQAPKNTRRHLYSGTIIITTLDKLLYRFFGFGETGKGYIFPLRINHGLRDVVFCFDEAHSYDDIAFTNFARLVRMLYEKGRDVVLMTATMPEQKVEGFFDFLDVVDYVGDEAKRLQLDQFRDQIIVGPVYPERRIEYIPSPIMQRDDDDANSTIDGEALVAAIVEQVTQRFFPNERMIVTIERVEDAYHAWLQLRDIPTAVFFYHGRLSHQQRRTVYQTLKQLDTNNKGYLLISTSAIEVGCDLNAHTLITQLCDPDRLIQRAGRCNRRRTMQAATVVVVGDDIPNWLTAFNQEDGEKQAYLAELVRQSGQNLNSSALLQYLNTRPKIDQRVEMYFDMLYDYVYDARLENKPLHDKGMIFTRSWEPTITVALEESERGLEHYVEVPISRFRARESDDQIDHNWHLLKRDFNVEEGRFQLQDVGSWQCAYSIDAIAMPDCDSHPYEEEVGWVHLPTLFNRGYTTSDGSRRVLVRDESSNGGRKAQLWYYTGA